MNTFRHAIVVACKGDYDHVRNTLHRVLEHQDRLFRSGVIDANVLVDVTWARKTLEQELHERYVVDHVA